MQLLAIFFPPPQSRHSTQVRYACAHADLENHARHDAPSTRGLESACGAALHGERILEDRFKNENFLSFTSE